MTAYRALVVSPEGRSDWRQIEASTSEAAAARLVADGVTPIDIRSGAVGLGERLRQPVRFARTIGLGEQALVLTQLATLIRAGLPVDRSLDLLREQAPKARLKLMLGEILAHVRSGGSLARGFERQGLFPAYVTGVLRAAERSGRLGAALGELAERITRNAATRQKLVTALTYPAAVLTATLMALALVLVLVVPQFESVFAGQEAKLPVLTQAVLTLSRGVRHHGMLLLAAAIIVPTLGLALLRARITSDFVQRHRASIPGLGLRDQYLAAQFTGVFATLIANGVVVVAAIPLAREAIASGRWKRHLTDVETRLREGRMLSLALGEGDFVPRTAVRLIEVGERSGQLAATCSHASTVMGEAAAARIDRIVSLANPISIVTLGGMVAMLVAGVMLGIFALGDFAG